MSTDVLTTGGIASTCCAYWYAASLARSVAVTSPSVAAIFARIAAAFCWYAVICASVAVLPWVSATSFARAAAATPSSACRFAIPAWVFSSTSFLFFASESVADSSAESSAVCACADDRFCPARLFRAWFSSPAALFSSCICRVAFWVDVACWSAASLAWM